MIRLFPIYTNRKQLSLKQFLLALFICASVVAWIGISTIQADEVDPGDYVENTEVNFQNAAQEQHAKNLAIEAALQDEAVTAAIESGNDEEARTAFEEAFEAYMQQISDRRAKGEGLGYIANDLGIHPGHLGLGHYKKNEELPGQNYSSQNKDRGLALGHSKDKDGSYGVDHGRGNGHGNGGGNGGGHGGGKNK
jgi:hypothetical protein